MARLDDEDGSRGGRVVKYWEKPVLPESDWASMTVLCFKPEVLYRILEKNQESDSYNFGKDIIPMLMEQNFKVYGYKFSGYWGYTGTINEYWQSNMDLLGPDPLIDMEKWMFRTNLEHRHIRDNEPALMGNQAVVHNSMIYNGCKIGGTVKNSILFPGVHVKSGAVVENSVIFFSNIIGENCRLNKVVSDVNNNYGRSVVVGPEECNEKTPVTMIGWNNKIPDQTTIGEGATVYPQIPGGNWPGSLKAGEVLR